MKTTTSLYLAFVRKYLTQLIPTRVYNDVNGVNIKDALIRLFLLIEDRSDAIEILFC